jgi:ribosomal protein S18 acetylase RimI-like enzyme
MLVQWAASMAHFELNHDRSQFAAREDDADPDLTLAAIFVDQGRVKAMIVSRMMNCGRQVDILTEHHVVKQCSEVRRRAINMIWVLRESRRLGVAKKLIKFLSDYCGSEIDEMGHSMPITPEALQLLRSMGLKQIFVV